MQKEYISYGIGGIVLGLVLGFIVGNWSSAPTTVAQTETQNQEASVNSSNAPQLPAGHPPISGTAQGGPAQQLPAGHPDVNGGSTGPAGPLPAGADASGSAAPAELPSFDPLPADSKDLRAEQKYKNIQVLKGVPADRWMSIMLAFKTSLGVDCSYCHVKDAWDKDDKANKETARKMIRMVKTINSQYTGGIGRVTCFTCHRGQERPAS